MSARRAVPAAAVVATVAFMCLQAPGLSQSSGDATVSQAPPPEKARVLVKDNYFEPRSTEVLAGGTVFLGVVTVATDEHVRRSAREVRSKHERVADRVKGLDDVSIR